MALLLTGLPTSGAAADPVADEKAHAHQLAIQIDELGRRDSALAERYDGAVLAQEQATARLAVGQRSLDAAAGQAAVADAKLRNLAVRSYVDGGMHASGRSHAGSPSSDVLKASYIQVLAGRSTDALDGARAARLDLAHQRTQLDSAKKAADAAVSDIASTKQDVATTEAKLQDTLGQVKGHLADLVTAEQSAMEAKAATDAQARIAVAQRTAAAAPPAAPLGARAQLGPVAASVGLPPAKAAPAGPAAPGRPAPTARPVAPGPLTRPPPVASASGAQAALAYARAQLGKPYVYGAAGPNSFDCSGLTMRAWAAGGVSLPHNAAAQYGTVRHIPFGSLQPGDLVFESGLGHVGIYIGGGQMIAAPHSGDVVKISAMWSSITLAGRP